MSPSPRQLCIPEAGFGRSSDVRWRDDVEAPLVAVARVQHEAALVAYRVRDRSLARRLGVRFGFSVKTWSDHCLGKRWASPKTWAALTSLTLEHGLAKQAVPVDGGERRRG